MSHDLAAELAGYRDELSRAEQYGNKGRVAAVRAEVARVESLLSDGPTSDASADADPPASQDASASVPLERAVTKSRNSTSEKG